jgi:CRISPR-associated endoribonuclease Cas6
MEYFELIVTTFISDDIHFTESGGIIGQSISKAMLLDEELKAKHKRNEYKYYCFNNFYPLESDKIYKKGRVYVFKIRTLDNIFSQKISKLITRTESTNLKIIAVEPRKLSQKHITELCTITPVLITVNNKHWLPEDDFMLLQQRLQANLEKKYKGYYKNKLVPEQSFIQMIQVQNSKPISYSYKNIKLLGNKFRIIVNEDSVSQKLAFIAEATGLGEKSSSAGMGFCNANYLE